MALLVLGMTEALPFNAVGPFYNGDAARLVENFNFPKENLEIFKKENDKLLDKLLVSFFKNLPKLKF